VEVCKILGHVGAGTFEFLFHEGSFYFIEVNPRVQAEHTVTEAVTGVDVVMEQIRVAAGEKLSVRQKDIMVIGHSIECRVNAERLGDMGHPHHIGLDRVPEEEALRPRAEPGPLDGCRAITSPRMECAAPMLLPKRAMTCSTVTCSSGRSFQQA